MSETIIEIPDEMPGVVNHITLNDAVRLRNFLTEKINELQKPNFPMQSKDCIEAPRPDIKIATGEGG